MMLNDALNAKDLPQMWPIEVLVELGTSGEITIFCASTRMVKGLCVGFG